MVEERKEINYRSRACFARTGHFCKNCELFILGINMCVFKCINANLGLIAKGLAGDTKTVERIKKDLGK